MGRVDYLKLGSWNACCDRCGRNRKGDELKKTWDGLWVCAEHWEPRHPQDFVRAVRENPTPPFIRKCLGVRLGDRSPSGIGVGRLVLDGAGPPGVAIGTPPVSGPFLLLVSDIDAQQYLDGDMKPIWVQGKQFVDYVYQSPQWFGSSFVHVETSPSLVAPDEGYTADVYTLKPSITTGIVAQIPLTYLYTSSGIPPVPVTWWEVVLGFYLSPSAKVNFDTYFYRTSDFAISDWWTFRSSDGLSWDKYTIEWNGHPPDGGSFGYADSRCLTHPVLFGSTLYRLISYNGVTKASTSSDGITWSPGAVTISSGATGINTEGGRIARATGDSGIVTSRGKVWTTTTAGVSWTYTNFFSLGYNSTIVDAAVSGSTFILLDSNGILFLSTNGGSTWAEKTPPSVAGTPARFVALVFGNGYFWAADRSIYKGLWRSSDAITWTIIDAWTTVDAVSELNSLYYGGY
jgi:hypothetical protein